jgi:prolipoprotein diacylglyceryltransferase
VLHLVAPRAVIEFAFDPIVRIGDFSVRLETLGIALVLFLTLVIAVLVAHGTPVDLIKPADAPGEVPVELNRLRADDLLYIAVAALPGAAVGARLGYLLLHWDFYQANPGALLDVTQGGLQLSLGVVGGVLTASIVAALLGAPLGRWLHAMAIPVLLGLAAGKAVMALGGSGQGQLSDASWATAYLGPGPWGSLAPQLAAHPAQIYEAVATLAVVVIVAWVLAFDAFPGRNGGAFLFAIGTWAIARAMVAATWRDPEVIGPLRVDQLISIAIAAVSYGLMLIIGWVAVVRGRRAARTATGAASVAPTTPPRTTTPGEPEWPDPSLRPRI